MLDTFTDNVKGFLLTNLALSGFPLFLFILFGLAIFTFSLIVAIIVGVVIAVLFSLSAIGVALMFVFPLIFFTTLTACFIFLLGLAAYWIFTKFNQTGPGNPGQTLGDKLNGITGGKLDYFMGQARESFAEQRLGDAQAIWTKGPSPLFGDKDHAPIANGKEKESDEEDGHHGATNDSTTGTANGTTKVHTNGTPKKAASHSKGSSTGTDAKSHGGNATDGVRKNANVDGLNSATKGITKSAGAGDPTEKVKGAPKKLNSTVGTVKGVSGGAGAGALGGATGLT